MLRIAHISKYYGGLKALDNVCTEIVPGMITGLIGPNGSGKTTLFNIISGWLQPDIGTVDLRGRLLARLSPHAIVRLGVTRMFQDLRLFMQMTCLENVAMGIQYDRDEAYWHSLASSAANRRKDRKRLEKAFVYLRSVGLEDKSDSLAYDLSFGQRRLLALARALAAEADVYLLDEPTAGVYPETKAKMLTTISALAKANRIVVLIEHDLHLIRDFAARLIVLSAGQKIADGATEAVLTQVDVIEELLGRKPDLA